MDKIPNAISDYIRKHFREGSYDKIRRFKTKDGHNVYRVEVVENDIIHHLRFDHEYKLVGRSSEPAFDEDVYER